MHLYICHKVRVGRSAFAPAFAFDKVTRLCIRQSHPRCGANDFVFFCQKKAEQTTLSFTAERMSPHFFIKKSG
jgi:hypothetical protein